MEEKYNGCNFYDT